MTGLAAENAVTLFSRVNVIIICMYYYDVIMSLTQSLVFKQFRRDFIIVWLAKSLFLHCEKQGEAAIQIFWFKKWGSWYVITSETHWITMHNQNLYIYIYTNMFVHVNSKNQMFCQLYQSWKETDLFCSDHAILGFPLLRVPCQCSLVLSDLNNWFRASFLFILSCLCLFWLRFETEKKKKMTVLCF